MDDTSKIQIELVKMKTTVYEMKNTWNGIDSRSYVAEQKIETIQMSYREEKESKQKNQTKKEVSVSWGKVQVVS